VVQLCDVAQSLFYVEDLCKDNSSQSFIIPLKTLSWSGAGYLKASRKSSYSVGRNCTFAFSSPYEIIISVKQIRFRSGCHDYLKIADRSKRVAICGSKNERDTNMQYYGKNIYVNYFTDVDGPNPTVDLTGFHLTYTPSQRDTTCEKYMFRCNNGYCINSYLICDGNNNCGDFSDETACSKAGIVTFVAMFIVSIMGLVGGFCISMCLMAVFSQKILRMNNIGNSLLLEGTNERTTARF